MDKAFPRSQRKSETEQTQVLGLLSCYPVIVKGVLWMNHKGSGVSSQLWGQLRSATLTLGKLLVLVFLRLSLDNTL